MDLIREPKPECAVCGGPLGPADGFCEQCGAQAPAGRPNGRRPAGRSCAGCGAPGGAIGRDGYCTVCGVRERAPAERVELDLVVAAAVSDQGRVHRRNEDAFHLELGAEGVLAAVVCDGVSSSAAGDVAAQAAARAAGQALASAATGPPPDLTRAIVEAVGAAQAAVELVPWAPGGGLAAPSCTLVAALYRDGQVAVGGVGDSRAYWVAGGGATQLTVDDSWAQEQVAHGRLTPARAARDPRFHAITHWLGADAPTRPPRTASLGLDGPGRLVLCSDGLWNYARTAPELAALIGAPPGRPTALELARSLTDAALARGGRDNITVAVLDIDPTHPPRSRR